MSTPRLCIEVTAEDQSDGDQVGRLLQAALVKNGFEDVTLATSSSPKIEQEEEVVEAIRALNPSLFTAEVTIETSTFDAVDTVGDEIPGEDFPEDEVDEELEDED